MNQTVFDSGTTCNLICILYFNLSGMCKLHLYSGCIYSLLAFINIAYRHFAPLWMFLAFLGEYVTQNSSQAYTLDVTDGQLFVRSPQNGQGSTSIFSSIIQQVQVALSQCVCEIWNIDVPAVLVIPHSTHNF